MSLFASKKQNEIDKLINENDDLKNQLHSVLLKHGGYEELEKNLARAKKELADLHLREESLNNSVALLDSNRIEKEKYLSDLNSKILELEEIKDSLHQTIQSYNTQVNLLEERSKELDEKLKHSTEIDIKLSTLLEKKDKLDHDIADKEQTFAYLSTIEREIQVELEKERNQLDSIKSQATAAENEIIELSSQHDMKMLQIDSLKESEETIQLKIESLNCEEIRKTDIIKSLEEKITLNEEIKNNLELNLGDLVARLNRSETQYTEHAEKREILSNDLLELKKEKDEFENKLSFAKEQMEMFSIEASKHSTLLAALSEEIQRIETARDLLQRELENLKQTEEKQLADIEEKKNTIEELEMNKLGLEEITLRAEKNFNILVEKAMQDFEDAKKINEDLQKAIEEKAAAAALLDKTVLESNSKYKELDGMIRLAEKEKDSLNGQIENSKVKKEELFENISLLRENISNYNSQFTSLRYETESLQIKKSDLQRDLSFLLTQISREYVEAENKLRLINESISSGNILYKELSDKITFSKAELKPLETPPAEEAGELPEESRNSAGERSEPEQDNDEKINPDGFRSFSLPEGMNDD